MQTSLSGLQARPKKICWLENGEIFGGAEMFGLEMIEQVAKNFSQDIEIHYLHNGNNSHILQKISDIQKILPQYVTLTAETFDLPQISEKKFSTLHKIYRSVKNLRTKIQHEKYDILYANTVRTGILLQISSFFLWGRETKIQKFFFAHDYTFPLKIQKFCLGKFTKIFSCSYPVKTFLMKQGLLSSDITVIENGVDIAKFTKIFPPKIPSTRIGVIGRITQWKGQLTVLKAARRIQELFPEQKIKFFFYGEPSPKEKDQEFFLRLQHFVEENNLQKIVVFKGFTALGEALKNTDILLHAAEEPEPFGRTPLEGAASGRPLLLSRLGTPAQIFTDQHDAVFFEAEDFKDLSEKIISLIKDPELQKKISQNAKELVIQKFSIEMIAHRFWKEIFG